MNRKKLYRNLLSILKKSEASLNEYELTQRMFKEDPTNEQIKIVYDLLAELERKNFVTKAQKTVASFETNNGNLFKSVDTRYSISIEGLSYSSSIMTVTDTTMTIIKKISITVLSGLILWFLTRLF